LNKAEKHTQALIAFWDFEDGIIPPPLFKNLATLYNTRKKVRWQLRLQEKDHAGAAQLRLLIDYCPFIESNLAQSYKWPLKNYPKFPGIYLRAFTEFRGSKCGKRISDKHVFVDGRHVYAALCDVLSRVQPFTLPNMGLNKNSPRRVQQLSRTLETRYQTEKKDAAIAAASDWKSAVGTIQAFRVRLALAQSILGIVGYFCLFPAKLKNQQLKQQQNWSNSFGPNRNAKPHSKNNDCWSQETCMINIGAQLTFIISAIENLKYFDPIQGQQLTQPMTLFANSQTGPITELRDLRSGRWICRAGKVGAIAEGFRYLQRAQRLIKKIKFWIPRWRKAGLVPSLLLGEWDPTLTGFLQEAIQNAIKYAEASEIQVSILQKKGRLHPPNHDKWERLWLNPRFTPRKRIFNIAKRAQELGGKLTINSGSREWTKRKFFKLHFAKGKVPSRRFNDPRRPTLTEETRTDNRNRSFAYSTITSFITFWRLVKILLSAYLLFLLEFLTFWVDWHYWF